MITRLQQLPLALFHCWSFNFLFFYKNRFDSSSCCVFLLSSFFWTSTSTSDFLFAVLQSKTFSFSDITRTFPCLFFHETTLSFCFIVPYRVLPIASFCMINQAGTLLSKWKMIKSYLSSVCLSVSKSPYDSILMTFVGAPFQRTDASLLVSDKNVICNYECELLFHANPVKKFN